jgi:AraC family transcriptional activator of pobA
MIHYKSLKGFLSAGGYPPPENSLITTIHCKDVCTLSDSEFTGDFYMIGFKKLMSGLVGYGRTRYDHENSCLSFIKPGQVRVFEKLVFAEDGFVILVHEDFLKGHRLQREIDKYGFFEYGTNEALHLSPKEERTIWELFRKIAVESQSGPDEFSREILLTHLDLILKYTRRYYTRQFVNRTGLSGATVSRFNEALRAYFRDDGLTVRGMPSVKDMAGQLHLSPRYLSDLLKQETGKTAIELIHIYMNNEAKNLLRKPGQNVSGIAYELGFDSLSYFSRLFKKEVGLTPSAYRKQLLN